MVTREVGKREVDGKEAVVVSASRSYDTSIEDLWDAVTDPERIPRWLAPIAVAGCPNVTAPTRFKKS